MILGMVPGRQLWMESRRSEFQEQTTLAQYEVEYVLPRVDRLLNFLIHNAVYKRRNSARNAKHFLSELTIATVGAYTVFAFPLPHKNLTLKIKPKNIVFLQLNHE